MDTIDAIKKALLGETVKEMPAPTDISGEILPIEQNEVFNISTNSFFEKNRVIFLCPSNRKH